MAESNHTPEINIDAKLAEFADQVLAAESGDADMSAQDLELQKLEEMVLLLNRAASTSRLQNPPDEMQSRIKNRLVEAWNKEIAPEKISLAQNLSNWLQAHQRQLAFSGMTLIASFLILTFLPGLVENGLTGTAGTPPIGEPAAALPFGLIFLISFAVAILVWFLTRTKN